MRGPVVIGGDNVPFPVRIGLTDLPNIERASGPPGPPGSGITERTSHLILNFLISNLLEKTCRKNIFIRSRNLFQNKTGQKSKKSKISFDFHRKKTEVKEK